MQITRNSDSQKFIFPGIWIPGRKCPANFTFQFYVVNRAKKAIGYSSICPLRLQIDPKHTPYYATPMSPDQAVLYIQKPG